MISETKTIFLSLAITIISAISALPVAFASFSVLENTQDCYDAGYEDGRDSPFDFRANEICREFTDAQGNPYYSGFVYGCMSVARNTMDACESATD